MKQIFDQIRAEMEKVKSEVNSPADVVWNNAVKMCLREVDEAEQKWEEDCCEWKLLHDGCFIQNPHTTRMFSNEESMQNVYCNTCGKKIRKIKVVE